MLRLYHQWLQPHLGHQLCSGLWVPGEVGDDILLFSQILLVRVFVPLVERAGRVCELLDQCEDFREGTKDFGRISTCDTCCVQGETDYVRQEAVLESVAELVGGAEQAASGKVVPDIATLLSAQEAKNWLPSSIAPVPLNFGDVCVLSDRFCFAIDMFGFEEKLLLSPLRLLKPRRLWVLPLPVETVACIALCEIDEALSDGHRLVQDVDDVAHDWNLTCQRCSVIKCEGRVRVGDHLCKFLGVVLNIVEIGKVLVKFSHWTVLSVRSLDKASHFEEHVLDSVGTIIGS